MDGVTLLKKARTAGLTVQADGDRLIVRGPRHAESLARELLAHKHLVLKVLTTTPDHLPVDWHLVWDERAAIMEYDGGLPRERAEAAALKEILNQMKRKGIFPFNYACNDDK